MKLVTLKLFGPLRLPKVIHLLPFDGIGGVETAARSMVDFQSNDIEFTLDYIYDGYRPTFSPLPILVAIYRLIKKNPDLLVVSLWRACIVGIIVKWFRPQIKLALFLHCPNDAHLLDKLSTRLLSKYAEQIWADSQATLSKRLPFSSIKEGKVISFVTQRINALPMKKVSPYFIFWGRIHANKNLERAVLIFADIFAHHPDARFIIIGPDGGELNKIQKQVNKLGLSVAVSFLGPMNMSEIKRQAELASFYLQTSELEGMAMSVVEAMQLGLLPIVTPVGEISNYCRDGENALLIYPNDKITRKIKQLILDNDKYQKLRTNSIATWQTSQLYSESTLQACINLLLKH